MHTFKSASGGGNNRVSMVQTSFYITLVVFELLGISSFLAVVICSFISNFLSYFAIPLYACWSYDRRQC